MKKLLFALFVVGMALSACSSKGGAGSLVGDWKLTAYGPADSPVPAVPDVEAVLNLSADGQVSGSLGCNRFGGDYKQKGSQIEFGSLAATLMACPEPQMLQEGAGFKIMAGSVDYKIEGRTLTITKDAEVLVFESVAHG